MIWRPNIYAACVCLSFSLCILGCQSEGGDLYDEYFVFDSGLANDLNTGDSAFKQGMAAYKNGRYQLASQFFRQTNSLSVGFDTLSFYLGLSEVGLERHAKGQSYIEVAVELGDEEFKKKAAWYKALLDIKLGRVDTAREIISSIADNENHPYREQASELLTRLD